MDIIKKTRRQIKRIKPVVTLDCDKALSFVCDSLVFIPNGKSTQLQYYKKMDVVLFVYGEPSVRLKGASDVTFVEPSTISLKLDVASKNGLFRIFPTFGRFRVDWDCANLHITRLPNVDETI